MRNSNLTKRYTCRRNAIMFNICNCGCLCVSLHFALKRFRPLPIRSNDFLLHFRCVAFDIQYITHRTHTTTHNRGKVMQNKGWNALMAISDGQTSVAKWVCKCKCYTRWCLERSVGTPIQLQCVLLCVKGSVTPSKRYDVDGFVIWLWNILFRIPLVLETLF